MIVIEICMVKEKYIDNGNKIMRKATKGEAKSLKNIILIILFF
jgi:hypothetical protein